MFHRDISTVHAVLPECIVSVCLVHMLYANKVKRVVIHLTEWSWTFVVKDVLCPLKGKESLFLSHVFI